MATRTKLKLGDIRMAKQRMTYVMSQAAIDSVRKIAFHRTVDSGIKVANGTVLEELIFKELDRIEKLDRSGRKGGVKTERTPATARKTAKGEITGSPLGGDLSDLDKELGL